jgi:hypothetical protein
VAGWQVPATLQVGCVHVYNNLIFYLSIFLNQFTLVATDKALVLEGDGGDRVSVLDSTENGLNGQCDILYVLPNVSANTWETATTIVTAICKESSQINKKKVENSHRV